MISVYLLYSLKYLVRHFICLPTVYMLTFLFSIYYYVRSVDCASCSSCLYACFMSPNYISSWCLIIVKRGISICISIHVFECVFICIPIGSLSLSYRYAYYVMQYSYLYCYHAYILAQLSLLCFMILWPIYCICGCFVSVVCLCLRRAMSISRALGSLHIYASSRSLILQQHYAKHRVVMLPTHA